MGRAASFQTFSEAVERGLRAPFPTERSSLGVCVVAIGGLSGSGKSTLARGLADDVGAVHLRSDAIRKALVGVPLDARAPAAAYTGAVGARTYAALVERGVSVARARLPVVLDATFLHRASRDKVEAAVHAAGLGLVGLWCEVPAEVALARVRVRVGDVSDADEDVLRGQLSRDPGALGDWARIDGTGSPAEVLARARAALGAWLRA